MARVLVHLLFPWGPWSLPDPPTSPGFLERDIPAICLADYLVTLFQFQSECRIQVDGRTRHERTVVSTKTGLRFPRLRLDY